MTFNTIQSEDRKIELTRSQVQTTHDVPGRFHGKKTKRENLPGLRFRPRVRSGIGFPARVPGDSSCSPSGIPIPVGIGSFASPGLRLNSFTPHSVGSVSVFVAVGVGYRDDVPLKMKRMNE